MTWYNITGKTCCLRAHRAQRQCDWPLLHGIAPNPEAREFFGSEAGCLRRHREPGALPEQPGRDCCGIVQRACGRPSFAAMARALSVPDQPVLFSNREHSNGWLNVCEAKLREIVLGSEDGLKH